MNKLDFSVFIENTWEVCTDGEIVIHIKKPSQKQLTILNGYDVKLKKAKNLEERLKVLNEVAVFILNNNKEDVKYEPEFLENKPIDVLYAIYYGYQGFITEVMSNPN